MTIIMPKVYIPKSRHANKDIPSKKSTMPWSFENLLMILPDGLVWKKDKGALRTDDNIKECIFVKLDSNAKDDRIKNEKVNITMPKTKRPNTSTHLDSILNLSVN